jgi:serine protease Do
MKMKPIITTGIAAFLIKAAFAIEAPVDNAPPPAVADGGIKLQAEAPDAKNIAEKESPKKNEDVAYLGVLASQVPEVLASHLGLKDGEGIAVQIVAPDGPAAKAGIVVNDIITRVGDKPVGSHQELSKLVTGGKPGDTLRLEIVHKGKKADLDVILGTRPEGMDILQPNPLIERLPLDGVPKEMADRIRGGIKGNIGGFKFNLGDLNPDMIAPKNIKEIEEMQKQLMKMGDLKELGVTDFQSTRMMDNEGSVEMKSTNGGKEVTLRDKNGNVTWSGPWDTEQDKAAAPENIRQRINRLNMDR